MPTTTPMLDRATLAQLTPPQKRAVLNEHASSLIGELINLASDGVLDHKNAHVEHEAPYQLQDTFTALVELSAIALREAIGFEAPLPPRLFTVVVWVTHELDAFREAEEARERVG
jgi:hypothetical protein